MSKLVECVPNISEGQNKEKIQSVVDAITTIPGVTLLDLESDKDHNRSVITIIGEPEAVFNGAFACIKKASEVIDLTKHKGEHPRMGATDVCPFIPIKDVTMEECVELAKRLGKKVYEELTVPVYLYEEAATRSERKNLADIRRGQFESLREEVKTNPEKKPDFGIEELHPTAGITAIGARMILIAYNVNLNSPDVTFAKNIGKAIRFKDGGFRYTKAMGFDIKERNISQVSMNMVNYIGTPLYRTFEFVKNEAKRYGLSVIGSEIVGLTPLKALGDAVAHEFRIHEFSSNMINWDNNQKSFSFTIFGKQLSQDQGNTVAMALTEHTGGFKGCKADYEDEKLEITIDNTVVTSMHRVYYTALSEIERFGSTITKITFDSIPLPTLISAAEFYLRLENFNINQILEVKLRENQ